MEDVPRPRPGLRAVLRDRSYRAAALIGAGTVAAVDEVVFHQLLGWHHLYDGSTTRIGMISDGLLHAAEVCAVVAGFVLLAAARRRDAPTPGATWAGFFVGLGAFQLWDGTIDHKVLRLHQVRYGVDLLPYDIAWNAAGALLLAVGVGLTVRASRHGGPAGT